MRTPELAQPLLDQRRVGQHPAVDCAVIDLKPALEEHAFEIAIAQRVAQIPGQRLDDPPRLEMASFEVFLRLTFELLDSCTQDHGCSPLTEEQNPASVSPFRKREKFATGPSTFCWRGEPARQAKGDSQPGFV